MQQRTWSLKEAINVRRKGDYPIGKMFRGDYEADAWLEQLSGETNVWRDSHSQFCFTTTWWVWSLLVT